MDVDRFTVDFYVPVVGPDQAVENVHQGGLASAVFAHQCVDFSMADLEIHVVSGKHVRGGEVLAHPAHVDGKIRGHREPVGVGEAVGAASPGCKCVSP